MAFKVEKEENREKITAQWKQLNRDIKTVLKEKEVDSEYALIHTLGMDRKDAQATVRILQMKNRPGIEIVKSVCKQLGLKASDYPAVGAKRKRIGGRKRKLPIDANDEEKIGEEANVEPADRLPLTKIKKDLLNDFAEWLNHGEQVEEEVTQMLKLFQSLEDDLKDWIVKGEEIYRSLEDEEKKRVKFIEHLVELLS